MRTACICEHGCATRSEGGPGFQTSALSPDAGARRGGGWRELRRARAHEEKKVFCTRVWQMLTTNECVALESRCVIEGASTATIAMLFCWPNSESIAVRSGDRRAPPSLEAASLPKICNK